MKRYLNLSMVATLVIAALSYNVANAKNSQPSTIKSKNISALASNDDKVRVFVNNQQRSLYQIALLSGVSVTELRAINKGDYDNVDVVKIGESIVLPASSSLLPVDAESVKKEDKYSHLPSLGSSDTVDITANDNVVETQVATVLQTLGQQDWENMTSDKIKEDLHNQSQTYAENYVRNQVHSQVIDPIRSAAQDFLGRFGTAQLQFDVSDQAKLNNVNVKLFSPWYDSDNTVIFSQLTYQEYEKDRRIGNFGVGQRWDVADKSWLLGYNVFFDHDFSRNHNRLGFGLEAWSDYMKFAANYYTPLSDWKDSKDFDDFLERAARGFDVRFQGYLPSYPHLGASLMFEQYFGEKVALFGKDHLQKDPYAVTVGVDYTPVPLFTIKGEHKQGQDANKQAKVELTMNYRIGVPLKDQVDPNMVDVARSLKGSRYDLVDRNNFIVLEYKDKKFSVDLALIDPITGKPTVKFYEDTVVPVKISLRNAKGNVLIDWPALGGADYQQLALDGGDLCYGRSPTALPGTTCTVGGGTLWTLGSLPNSDTAVNHSSKWTILVPPYIDSLGNPNTTTYQFTVHAKDSSTNKEDTSAPVQLEVLPHALRKALINNNSAGNVGTSTVPAAKNQTVKLVAHLEDTRTSVGFNDATVHANYHPDTAGNPVDISKVSSLWKATKLTRASTNVAFVDGTVVGATCGSTDCLLVKSVKPVTGSPNTYELEVATDATLGTIAVSPVLGSYPSESVDVHFASTRTISNVSITDVTAGTPPVVTPVTGPHITLTGTPIVGHQYELVLQDSTTTNINDDYTITWSLVGDNAAACFSSNTVLPGDDAGTTPVANLFAVKQDVVGSLGMNPSTYTIRGLLSPVSFASSPGISPVNSSVTATPLACAGDQGFKLRIDIE